MIEITHAVIKRMSNNAKASYLFRQTHGGRKRIKHQRPRHVLPLILFIDGELAEQQGGNRIWLVTLMTFWQMLTFNLGCREADITCNFPRLNITYHAHA